MNKSTAIACIVAVASTLAMATAHAGDAPADGRGKQQSRMKTCNADAKGKHGDERRAFMKTCLSSHKTAAQVTASK